MNVAYAARQACQVLPATAGAVLTSHVQECHATIRALGEGGVGCTPPQVGDGYVHRPFNVMSRITTVLMEINAKMAR